MSSTSLMLIISQTFGILIESRIMTTLTVIQKLKADFVKYRIPSQVISDAGFQFVFESHISWHVPEINKQMATLNLQLREQNVLWKNKYINTD